MSSCWGPASTGPHSRIAFSLGELAAAYVELRMLGAQTGWVDAIETACGIPDDTLPKEGTADRQADFRRAYLEQLRRQNCPGCGNDEFIG